MDSFQAFYANYVYTLECLAAAVAIIILLSSIDDLFVDIWYWGRTAYRWVYIRTRYRRLPIEALRAKEEQPIAIMVPAWQEYEVIAKMIENTVATMEYRRFVIFAGVYQNDPATSGEVDRMARRFRQVVKVVVPHDGPTCKADCLNWVIQAIFRYEETHELEFAGIILHDSEDVIHPLELKLFNYLLPRMDLIQLPVLSLERGFFDWVAATYMDDFAEWHGKDLVVRESMLGQVPSAGVATCFSNRAMKALAAERDNQPFNTETLTEDYDFSQRLADQGMRRQVFVRFPITFRTQHRSFFGKVREVERESVIATYEFFPHDFWAAVRQRARWTLGIALQGWVQIGWTAKPGNFYMLVRDRKGVFTSLTVMFAYLLALNFVIIWVTFQLDLGLVRYPPAVETSGWLTDVLVINGVLLLNRVFQRFYFVSLAYNWRQGLLAIPRMVVNNFINFFATVRALRLFMGWILFSRRLTWDKTQHSFPTTEELATIRRQLGELLTSWNAIQEEHLEQALNLQSRTGQRLGRILVGNGWVDDDLLADALAYQTGLPRAELRPDTALVAGQILPLRIMVKHRVVPLGRGQGGVVRLGSAGPLSEATLAEIRDGADLADIPTVWIVREREIALALRLLCADDPVAAVRKTYNRRHRLLGDILVDGGALKLEQLERAVATFDRQRDGAFGMYLVNQGLIDEATLLAALELQERETSEPAYGFVQPASPAASGTPAAEPGPVMASILLVCGLLVGSLLLGAGPAAAQGLDRTPLSGRSYTLATQVYDDLSKNQPAAAEQAAREALALRPNNAQLLGLLAATLQRQGKTGEAEAVLDRMLAAEPTDVDALLRRAQLRSNRGDGEGALADYQAALAAPGITSDQVRLARLSAADLYSKQGQPDRAREVLGPLAQEQDYDVQARLGYIDLAAKDYPAAATAFGEAANSAQTPDQKRNARLGLVQAYSGMQDYEEARRTMQTVLADNPDDKDLQMQMGYLLAQADQPEEALPFLESGIARPGTTVGEYVTVGYVAKNAEDFDKASQLFRQAIDTDDTATDPEAKLEPEYREGLRREIRDTEKTFGGYLSATYVTQRSDKRGGDAAFGGGEIWWRPPYIGNVDGRTFDVYATIYQGLWEELYNGSGKSSLQATAGFRYSPFPDVNFNIGAERLFKIGRATQDDWALRTAIGESDGQELDFLRSDWPTWSAVAVGAYRIQDNRGLGFAEAEYGHTFRLDPVSDHLGGNPFVSITGDYDSKDPNDRYGLGAGPGVRLRYWFGDDHYRAPDKRIDLSAQYRFSLNGSNRWRGLYLQALTAF